MADHAMALIVQALRSVAAADAVYLVCPVGSGMRELDLMVGLRLFDQAAVRTMHRTRWRREVLEPNIADARAAADRVRARLKAALIDPSWFDVSGYSQDDYDGLCENLIASCATRLVLAPGWAFSRGARVEVGLALRLGMPTEDLAGHPLSAAHLAALAEGGRQYAEAVGVPVEQLDVLLPPIEVAAVSVAMF
jgi:hypothetical protein